MTGPRPARHRRGGQRPRGTWPDRRVAVLAAVRASGAVPLNRNQVARIVGVATRSALQDLGWLEENGYLARTRDDDGYIAYLGV